MTLRDYPEDIYTEPSDVDIQTLKNLGPLTRMAGIWEGRRSLDVNPKAEGPEEQAFIERIELHPIDPQTNGPQFFYGLPQTRFSSTRSRRSSTASKSRSIATAHGPTTRAQSWRSGARRSSSTTPIATPSPRSVSRFPIRSPGDETAGACPSLAHDGLGESLLFGAVDHQGRRPPNSSA